MPFLTPDEAAELKVKDEQPVEVSVDEYMKRRYELLEAARTTEEASAILKKYPHPAEMAEQEARERADQPYEGYGRELSSDEQKTYYEELEAAPTSEAAAQVHRRYGRLDPTYERENSLR